MIEYLPPDNKVGSIIEKIKLKSKQNGKLLIANAHMEILG